MDEEIDLRPYFQGLISHWWVPLVVAAIGMLAALALNLSQPESYQASAMVVIAEPAERVVLDSRFQINDRPDELLNAYPELAQSDDVLKAVLADIKETPGAKFGNVSALRGRLRANTGKDPRVLYLRATHADPKVAAALANAWAEEFVRYSNVVYGNQGGLVDYYTEQLASAQGQAASAEQALSDYQAVNRLTLATNEYSSLSQLQIDYLANQRRLQQVLADIGVLREQIRAGNGAVPFADQYTALMLQLRTYTYGEQIASATPVAVALAPSLPQFLVNGDAAVTTTDRGEQLALLESLASATQSSLASIGSRLGELEPQLLAAQRDVQESTAELTRLTIARDVANETVGAIARRLDAERLTAGAAGQSVRLGSEAAVPSAPVSQSLALPLITAGVLGFLIGILIVLLYTWWRRHTAARQAQAQPTASTPT